MMKGKKHYSLILKLLVVLAIAAFVAVMIILNSAKQRGDEKKSGEIHRVISLLPSLTQSIYFLNAQDKLVGCTSYCKTNPKDSIEMVASFKTPNIEKIVSLKPDVVLASDLVSEKDVQILRKFGIRVEKFASPKSFKEICSQFIRLGKLVEKEKEATAIVQQSKEKVKSIQRNISGKNGKPKIFIQIGASPIYAVIPDTFLDDYITFCGGTNIGGELQKGIIGREFVIAKNPDVIFIVTMGMVGKEEAEQWKRFRQMNAVVKNKVFVISSEIACQPTPITFIKTLEVMNQYITK